MTEPVITARGLGKRYRLGETYPTLRSSLAHFGRRTPDRHIWAVRDLDLEVPAGQVLGIIGKNGAGKTTLLKMLGRVTAPTEGSARVRGRVGNLLQVGTGFHPELSGRDNVFLSGAILGMRRADLRARFDEIVAFAGVERFIDTPVKRYSAGMWGRLAFAVAAHLEPDILLVDEVLAVGDKSFQKKCLGRIRGFANSGRTVLFVTHNLEAIATLTDRCICLADGRCSSAGEPAEVIRAHLAQSGSRQHTYTSDRPANGPLVSRVEVQTSEPGAVHRHGEPLEIVVDLTTPRPLDDAAVWLKVSEERRGAVLEQWTYDADAALCRRAGRTRLRCRLPRLRLYAGQYFVTVGLSEHSGRRILDKLDNVCGFEVAMLSRHQEFRLRPASCIYVEDCTWQVSNHGLDDPAHAAKED